MNVDEKAQRDLYSLVRGLVYAPTVDQYNEIVASLNDHLNPDAQYHPFLSYLQKEWFSCNFIWNLRLDSSFIHHNFSIY